MVSRYPFWLRTAAVFQLLTAAVHSLSFFRQLTGTNDTERQLIELFTHYKMDMGYGFHPTMYNLFTSMSAAFTLLYFFGGIASLYLLSQGLGDRVMKGWTGISVLVFGVCFLVVLLFAFLPPVIMTGLVFVCLSFAYATNHIHRFNSQQEHKPQ